MAASCDLATSGGAQAIRPLCRAQRCGLHCLTPRTWILHHRKRYQSQQPARVILQRIKLAGDGAQKGSIGFSLSPVSADYSRKTDNVFGSSGHVTC